MAVSGKEYGSKPAFPSSRVEEEVRAKVAYNEGVSRRDVFAAFAMQGLIAQTPVKLSAAEVARQALLCADALCNALAEDAQP